MIKGKIDYEYSEVIDENVIISQNPSEGSRVSEYVPINFLVSKGKNKDVFLLPNFIGKNYEYACKILSDYNIKYKLKLVKTDDKNKINKIIAQNIKSGKTLNKFDSIELTIASVDNNEYLDYRCISFDVPLDISKYIDKKKNKLNLRLELKKENNNNFDRLIIFDGLVYQGEKLQNVINYPVKLLKMLT